MLISMALKEYFNQQPEVVSSPVQHAQCSCFCCCLPALGTDRTTTKQVQRKLKAAQTPTPPLPTFASHSMSLCSSPAFPVQAEMHFLPAQQPWKPLTVHLSAPPRAAASERARPCALIPRWLRSRQRRVKKQMAVSDTACNCGQLIARIRVR